MKSPLSEWNLYNLFGVVVHRWKHVEAHSIEVCLMGGGYRVTVMIHLDDSQVKYKTEKGDFDHNHSPGDQTHLSMTATVDLVRGILA